VPTPKIPTSATGKSEHTSPVIGNVVDIMEWAEQHSTPSAVGYAGRVALDEATARGDDEQVRHLMSDAAAHAARATFHVVQPHERVNR